MTTRTILAAALFAPAVAAAAPPAFPADTAFHPLHCHGHRMTDLAADVAAGVTLDRDIVGDGLAPAGLRTSDAQNLYLRLRINRAPDDSAGLRPYAWGMAFDLDDNRQSYELLIVAEGISAAAGTVSIYTNHTTTIANSPADPADLPAAAVINFADAGRVTTTTAKFSGDADDWIDLAIPWTTLQPLGLDRGTPVHVWAGTSSVANALDGDLACYDGTAGITLEGADPSDTTGDPAMDPGGDGGDDGTGADPGDPGVDPATLRLEGGSGCATTSGSTSGSPSGSLGAGLLLALALLARRRR